MSNGKYGCLYGSLGKNSGAWERGRVLQGREERSAGGRWRAPWGEGNGVGLRKEYLDTKEYLNARAWEERKSTFEVKGGCFVV